jgi:hypothetical protein
VGRVTISCVQWRFCNTDIGNDGNPQ